MDNITHSLIGITLGCAGAKAGLLSRKQAVLASVIASNFADVDVMTRLVFPSENLPNLLYHRGMTHSIVFAPLFAALSTWLVLKFVPETRPDTQIDTRTEKHATPAQDALTATTKIARVFTISLIAALMHLMADFWNDYGIHPFWPFQNRWYYGDLIFIVEPFLWLSMLPLFFFAFKARVSRIAAVILMVWPIILAFSLSPEKGWLTALALFIWAIVVSALQFAWIRFRLYRIDPEVRDAEAAVDSLIAVPSVFSVLSILAVFMTARQICRDQIANSFGQNAPQEKILALSTSPFPANPFLWRALLMSTSPKYGYRVHLATVSLWPEVFATPGEFFGVRHSRMAPVSESTLSSTPSLHWIGEFRGSMIDMASLSFNHCEFGEFLRFSRAPFWVKNGANHYFAGDLRYDHEPGLGFAKIELKLGEKCPNVNAPWVPPLSFDDLGGGQGSNPGE